MCFVEFLVCDRKLSLAVEVGPCQKWFPAFNIIIYVNMKNIGFSANLTLTPLGVTLVTL